MLHVLIAMVLAPLLLIKVVIVRYYKTLMAALVPQGLTIFTLGFVLIASSAGPEISLQTVNMRDKLLQLVGNLCDSCIRTGLILVATHGATHADGANRHVSHFDRYSTTHSSSTFDVGHR